MFGAFAGAFARTFPKAEVMAVDFWKEDNSGLKDLPVSEELFLQYTGHIPNITHAKLDYTELSDIESLPRDFDMVFVGGPISKNCLQLLSHFSEECLITGVQYTVAESDPNISYSGNCQRTTVRRDLKKSLVESARSMNRDIYPFGCYYWMMPPRISSL